MYAVSTKWYALVLLKKKNPSYCGVCNFVNLNLRSFFSVEFILSSMFCLF